MIRRAATGAVISLLLLQSCAHDPARALRQALDRGQRFYAQGSYGEAEIQFRKALQANPKSGEAWLKLGHAQEALGSYTPAFDSYQHAAAIMPGEATPRVALGNFLLIAYLGNVNHPANTRNQLTQISDELLAADPNSFEGIRLQAYLASSAGNPADAVEKFSRANRIKPDQADIITALCQNLMSAGRSEEGVRLGLVFLNKNPGYRPLYSLLSQFYLKAGHTAEAEGILRRGAANNPKDSHYRIDLARLYESAGRPADSLKVLETLASDSKDFPEAQMEVGDYYMEKHDWATAIRYYNAGAQTQGPSRARYWKRLVQADLAANDTAAAGQMLDQILKSEPDDSESLASRAALRMATNDPAQRKMAISELKSLVVKAPGRVDYLYRYADALRADGQVEAARAQYLLVIQKKPSDEPALRTLADLSIRGQHFEEALAYSDRLLALEPDDVQALLVRSTALAAKGRFAETHTILTSLATQHPGLREAQYQLALLDIEQRHYPEAESRLRRLYSPGKGDIRSLKGLVEVYRAQDELDRAVGLLTKEVELAPQRDDVRGLLASTAAQSGHKDIALAQYQQLARTQPGSFEIATQFGLMRQNAGDLSGARAEFERARSLAPGSPMVYALLGKVQEDQGKPTEAAASYQKSLSLDSEDPWVMNNLAYLMAEHGGDLREAMTLAEGAVRRAPANPFFNDTVGWIYFRKKDFPSALHVFESLREKRPNDVGLRIRLSQALFASGDRPQARKELETALTLPATAQERKDINQLLRVQ